ncbi:AraC family transcriptional regulator [Photobacterium sp. SDRW27]|uniref:AraC family transcriptional regulator n=1 Tax=Photobacterium obscurum TaxID=2829490 RepID=UPI0022444672|nr:helix-turn-helix transcriptional regulator [Photobacterium obscurum]MCW8331399.1 AraC family transcriptional regulator [Photobacterium obscurum]
MKDIVSIELDNHRSDIAVTMYSMQDFYERYRVESVQPHRLGFNAIIYVTKGRGEHYIDYKLYKLKPGAILFVSRYQVHHFVYTPELDGYIVPYKADILYFGKEDPLRDKIDAALGSVNYMSETDSELKFYFQQLWGECQHREHLFNAEVIRLLIRGIILKTIVASHHHLIKNKEVVIKRQCFDQLSQLIESRYCQTRTVADYAAIMGKSVKQLNRVAKENTGKSVKELIDDRLILECKRLLAFSHHSICDISAILGFDEATNMTKFFKRHTNITPKQFRELAS